MTIARPTMHISSKTISVGITVIVAQLVLSACSTLFDAPSVEGMKEQVSAKVMSDLAKIAAEEALIMMPEDFSTVGSTAEQTVTAPNDMVADFAGGLASDAASSGIGMVKNRNSSLSVDKMMTDGTTASGNTSNAGTVTSSGGKRAPTLSFDKVDAEMPQLMMQGMGNATVLLNGEKIESRDITRGGRIMLIQSGRHVLKVEYPSGPPFSADFYIEKGERLTLRGN